MRVALQTPFAASKKEPLGEMVGRLRQIFLVTGLGEPEIRFTLIDLSTNAIVQRVLKRYPEMERFAVASQTGAEGRMLSNAATGEQIDFATIQALAAGVPRSYPFKSVGLYFYAPAFGERLIGLPRVGHSLPGVMVTDNWWVSGRQRALSIYTVVEAEMTDNTLPPHPEQVAAVIEACGKAKKTVQVPILAPGGRTITTSIPAENIEAVKAVTLDYRARMQEVVEFAALPHRLPPLEKSRAENVGVVAGPRKPALVEAFKPMGYDCRGGSGEFHLTRRTAGHLDVELYLDVGTWSHTVTAMFVIQGAGFRTSLTLPVSIDSPHAQYPMGDAAQWRKIVENLAAMVRELDRSFVVAVEQAAGPSPAWYQSGA